MPRRSSPLRNVPQIVSQIPVAYRSPEVLNPEVEKRFLLVLLGQLTPDEHVSLRDCDVLRDGAQSGCGLGNRALDSRKSG